MNEEVLALFDSAKRDVEEPRTTFEEAQKHGILDRIGGRTNVPFWVDTLSVILLVV